MMKNRLKKYIIGVIVTAVVTRIVNKLIPDDA